MTEFSRPVRIDRLSTVPTELRVEATPEERRALAGRFGLIDVASLAAEVRLVRNGELVRAEGALDARVTQSCVATDVPVEADVRTDFALAFHPAGMEQQAEERELSSGELDVLFYQGDSIDMGEAAAETLALSLDPWPRAPDAEEKLRAAGVKAEDETDTGPFSALAGLKAQLEGKE